MTSYVPIQPELHRNKSWIQRASLNFAKGDTVTPLFVNELSDAVHSMPIAFVKHGQSFTLAVVMGLRASQNLFVSAEGKWLSEYMPVTYRSSPFALLPAPGDEDQQFLCIDEECVVDGDDGKPFFDEEGQVSESVNQIMETLKVFNASRHLTRNICAVLAEHGIIQPWEVVLNNEGIEQPVNGLYKIDESAMNNLSGDAFLALRSAGALTVAYAQLFSMQKMGLIARLIQQSEIQTQAKSDVRETFDFGGL